MFSGTVLILARSGKLTERLGTRSSGKANVPSLVSLDYFHTPIFPFRFGNYASILHLLSSYLIFSFAFSFLENVHRLCLHKVCFIVAMTSERISIINYSQCIVIMLFQHLHREIGCKMNGTVCVNLSFALPPKPKPSACCLTDIKCLWTEQKKENTHVPNNYDKTKLELK